MALKNSFMGDNTVECGCDEAGRGCIAGPLFVAAVIFPKNYCNEEINDSKQLSRNMRNLLRIAIEKDALAYSVVPVPESKIDEINILNATFWGMNEAVRQLDIKPDLLLIDGNRFINRTDILHKCIVKGDATYLSIAAASILAKTYRDDYMEQIDLEFPLYEWKKNKGYPTPDHQKAVLMWGRTKYHRKSFSLKNQLRLDF
jgi:ribonuclease HII